MTAADFCQRVFEIVRNITTAGTKEKRLAKLLAEAKQAGRRQFIARVKQAKVGREQRPVKRKSRAKAK